MKHMLGATLFTVASCTAAHAGVFSSVDEAKDLQDKPNVRFVAAAGEKGHIPGTSLAYAHDFHLLDDVKACNGLPTCEPRGGVHWRDAGRGRGHQGGCV